GIVPRAPAAVRLLERRQQRGEFGAAARTECVERGIPGADEWPECARERRERKLSVGLLDCLASQHHRAVAGELLLQLTDQPRLADAGVPAEQDQRRLSVSCLPRRARELLQLTLAAHELIACQAG